LTHKILFLFSSNNSNQQTDLDPCLAKRPTTNSAFIELNHFYFVHFPNLSLNRWKYLLWRRYLSTDSKTLLRCVRWKMWHNNNRLVNANDVLLISGGFVYNFELMLISFPKEARVRVWFVSVGIVFSVDLKFLFIWEIKYWSFFRFIIIVIF